MLPIGVLSLADSGYHGEPSNLNAVLLSHGGLTMRICTITFGFALLFATVLIAVADDAPPANSKKTFRFFLEANESQQRLVAVPALENEKPPKNVTVVTCDSLRFEKTGIVFVNVTMESEENRITAAEMTVKLDKMSGPDVSWDVSDDFKMTLKIAEAKQRFLSEHTR